MDAGQMIVQMSVGAAGGAAAQAAPAAPAAPAAADAGGQQAGVFAGLMNGFARQDQDRPADQAAETSGDLSADKANLEAAIEQMDMQANADVMAALINEMMKLPEARSEVVQADMDQLQGRAGDEQGNVLMPQNVAMPAAVLQADGRMPVSLDASTDFSKGMADTAKSVIKVGEVIRSLAESKGSDMPSLPGDAGIMGSNPVKSSASGSGMAETAKSMIKVGEVVRSLAEGKGSDQSLPAGNTIITESAPPLVSSEKMQVMPQTADFKFSRSVFVDAALGNGQPVNDQAQEKLMPVMEKGIEVAEAQQVSEADQGNFKQPDSGSDSKGSENFSRQTFDMPKPVAQQLAGSYQLSTVDGTVSTQPQTLQAEPERLAASEHVAGQVKEQLVSREIKQGSEQITIKLSPDHLGDIKVNFRLDDQRLKVEIVAENRAARESLLQHADSLKESLARQNISMEKFEVTSGSNSFSGQGNNAQGGWRELAKNRQSQQWLSAGGYRTSMPDNMNVMPAYFARAEQSTLDLHF